MSLRDKINQDPKLGIGIGAAILVIAVIFIIVQSRGSKKLDLPPDDTTKGYFTDDDGATTFTAPLTNVPPFDHNGKKAVRVQMFVAANGEKFIGWLEQYDDAAKKRIETRMQNLKSELPERELHTEIQQVKKPKDKTWAKVGPNGPGQDYRQAMTPAPPDGNTMGYKGPIHPGFNEK